MERAVEGFVAVGFFGVGLSHFVQPLAWVEFFVWLRGQGRSGVFLEGLLNLNIGALIVAFHNVWTGLPVVVTVVGWGLVVKGLVRLAPGPCPCSWPRIVGPRTTTSGADRTTHRRN